MTDLPFYSYEDLLVMAKRVVEEKGPEFIYKGELREKNDPVACRYYEDDEQRSPSCVVGHMFDETPLKARITSSDLLNGSMIGYLITAGIFKTDERGMVFVSCLQQGQDAGIPWGEALEFSIERTQRQMEREK